MKLKDKIYGEIEVTEPVVDELINSSQVERLKGIHQSGIYYYAFPECDVTRFEHSLGVMLVLRKFKASLAEQAAGLLHDVSHGVFSHVMDHLYGTSEKEDYQDSLHSGFFDGSLKRILSKHNLNPSQIADLEAWPLLDCFLPDICADRLDYTLRDAFANGRIGKAAIEEILSDLKVEDNKFIFGHLPEALKFANLSLWLSRNYWHVGWGEAIFKIMSDLLRLGLDKKIITEADLLTQDHLVMAKLEQSAEPGIVKSLGQLKNFQKDKVAIDRKNYDFKVSAKFRVTNPLINLSGSLKRVSELSPEFNNDFQVERARVKEMTLRILD